MRSHHDSLRPWRAFGLILLGAATFLVMGAMLLVILRSEEHALDRFLPGWPWW